MPALSYSLICTISIHALRVEGDLVPALSYSLICTISIHALRVEGDSASLALVAAFVSISIHALRVEGDAQQPTINVNNNTFLSTPSGWRATGAFARRLLLADDFYPRPPGGGRLTYISLKHKFSTFLSTPSGWRATVQLVSPLLR